MLKITKASDPIPVTTITLCAYSVPGIGKTSLGYTADRPLLLDFDKGAHRSKNRRDTVRIETWTDVAAITDDDLKPFGTVVVDTAGRALDVLTAHILKNNPKAGNRAGGLSLQGYGELKSIFTSWLKFVRSFGLDVVLLSHSEEQKDGDDMKERLDIQGGSKSEICKASDSMARLYLHNGKRTLNFSPTDTAFGKNPANLPPLEVPNFAETPDFLASVIARTKASLNELSAEQTEVAGLLAAWKEKVDAAVTAADFNALMPLGKDLDERIRDNAKRVLVKAARDKEILFDVKAGGFVGGKADAPAAVETKPEGAPPVDEVKPEQAAQPEREPGSDDDEEANRKAAEPTASEAAQMEIGKVASGRAKKGRAA
jgi:hypothetical protein